MAHKIKCVVCGEIFDTDYVQAVKKGARRYAHYICYPEGELVPLKDPPDPDLVELEKYVANLFQENYNPAKVKKQIKDFREQYDYSYSGILKSLIWWYEIKGNSVENANGGLGIVPFIYQDAKKFYYDLYLVRYANETILSETKTTEKKIVKIKSPRTEKRKVKLFNIEEEEEWHY